MRLPVGSARQGSVQGYDGSSVLSALTEKMRAGAGRVRSCGSNCR